MDTSEYIATHQAFSLENFRDVLGWGRTPYNLLVRAVEKGKVDRVVPGVYVSKTGRFTGLVSDGYRIASAFANDVVFAYRSALALNGVAQSSARTIQFYSSKKVRNVVYENLAFASYAHPKRIPETKVVFVADESYRVTTSEQTLVDCLNYPARAGGAEEVIRSLSSFRFINVERIKALVPSLPKASIARIGWLLAHNSDQWNISDVDRAFFKAAIKGGTYRFSPSEDRGIKDNWDSEWRLYLPAPREEVQSWR